MLGKKEQEPVLRDIDKPEEEMRGLGDAVAKVTTALGIKPCPKCKKRIERLNRAVPFGRQDK